MHVSPSAVNMSDAGSLGASFMTDTGHHRSYSLVDAYPSPSEMYRAGKGLSSDWGIPGYEVPLKSITYRSSAFKVTKTQRKTVFDEVEKRSKEPDPTKYQPDLTKNPQPKKHRPTFRAKRNTYVDMIFKSGSLSPGPASYYTQNEKGEGDRKKTRGFGFNKADGASFLSEIQCQSMESPGAGHYFQETKGTKLSSSLRNNYFFMKSAPVKPSKDTALGPGVYHHIDYVTDPKRDKLKTDPVRVSPPRPIMPKSKRVSVLEQAAKAAKDVPGVGHYQDAVQTLTCFPSDLKKIRFFTPKEKGARFPDTHIKARKAVPGPGHYSHEDREDALRKRG